VEVGIGGATFCLGVESGSKELRMDDLPTFGKPIKAITRSSSSSVDLGDDRLAVDHSRADLRNSVRPRIEFGVIPGIEVVEVKVLFEDEALGSGAGV